MADKTNVEINGTRYYRLQVKIGRRVNKHGEWVDWYKTFYGKNKKEAEKKYQDFLNDNKSTSSSSALGEVMEFYIRTVLIPDGSLKESTKSRYISAYRNNLAAHDIAGRAVKDITAMDLQGCYNDLQCAPSTVRSLHKLVTRLYRYLAAAEGITDITGVITLPKVPKKGQNEEIEVWTPEELQRIITGSEGQRLHMFYVMAAGTGLRLSELLALQYSDITPDGLLLVRKQVYPDPVFQDGEITGHVPVVRDLKSKNSARSIPLNDFVLQELEKHREWQRAEMRKRGYKTDYLFTTSSGSIYDSYNIRTALRRFCRAIGVPYKPPKTFRHTFASTLAAQGVPIQDVSALLGHADISVTAKYYVNVPEDRKRAAVNKLQFAFSGRGNE